MRNDGQRIRRWLMRIAALAIWLGLWEITSRALDQRILLVSPFEVARILWGMLGRADFYASIASSFARIALGFLIALAMGALLAGAAHVSEFVDALLSPLMTCIKSTPVASFVILALVWIRARDLAVFISFLMGLPIFYAQVRLGLSEVDPKLLEVADVYRVQPMKRVRYIYLPSVKGPFVSACQVAVGLCWKAGIAAEVIGLPDNSIGEQLYEAKLFLNTGEMLAWTMVIIVISLLCERLMKLSGGGGKA